MRDALAGLALLLLAACRDADPRELRPSPLVVDRIERLLDGRPCIGPLARWQRHYFHPGSLGPYEPPGWGVDRGVIVFVFKEAGRYGMQPGRRLDAFLDQDLDERQMRIADGRYDIASGALSVDYCGSNWPTTPAEREQIERRLKAAR